MATKSALYNVSRRVLWQLSPNSNWQSPIGLRLLSKKAEATPPSKKDEGNLVAQIFLEEHAKYSKFIAATENCPIPLSGDEKEVRNYHNKMLELRKKFGIPDDCERLQGLMKLKVLQSRNNVRAWVQSMEGTLGEELFEVYMDAVNEIEKETGEVLMFDKNSKGFPIFKKKFQVIMKKYGVTPETKKSDLLFEEEKSVIERAVTAMKEKVDEMKKRFGMEDVQLDVTKIKMTLASKNN